MQQLLIHRLNVIFLGEERLKEFEQILFGADVLVQPYFFYDLAQLEGFLRPENYAKKISLKNVHLPLGQSFVTRIELIIFEVGSLKENLDFLFTLFETNLLL